MILDRISPALISINPLYTSDFLISTFSNSEYSDEMPHNAALKISLSTLTDFQRNKFSKICVNLPLKNRQNKDLNDKW